MSKEILTKCGYRCDLCLAYKKNVEKKDERSKLSDGWHAIYGFRIEPEKIICEGCVSSENPILIDKNCPVRPCAIEKKIETCAECEDYICDKLKQRIVNRSELEEKLGIKLTDGEYKSFVLPYESKPRLDKIRNCLK